MVLNQNTWFEVLKVLLSFIAGAASATAAYLGVRRYRQELAIVDLVAAHGSPRLSPEAEAQGYCWAFYLDVLNRRDKDQAVTAIEFQPATRRIRRRIRGNSDGWVELQFDDVLYDQHEGRPEPLRMAPFQYRRLVGHCRTWWFNANVCPPGDYWRSHPKELQVFTRMMNDLHNEDVNFRLTYASGGRRVVRFRRRRPPFALRAIWHTKWFLSDMFKGAGHRLRDASLGLRSCLKRAVQHGAAADGAVKTARRG